MSEVAVFVAETAFTSMLFGAPSSRMRSVVPGGVGELQRGRAEGGRELAYDRSHAAGEIEPDHAVVGIGVALFGSGSAAGSSTRTSVTVCCAPLVLSV